MKQSALQRSGYLCLLPWRWRLAAMTVLLFSPNSIDAQIGLGGFSAVMTTPTAKFLPDGHIAVGFGYIPSPYAIYERHEGIDNLAYFATIGFLPFVEVSLRGTLGLKDSLDVGDRTASVRLRVLTEDRHRPALALGLHDVKSVRVENGWFNALYAVATKSVSVSNAFRIETSAGYGVDWLDAHFHEFNGLFGGVCLGFHRLVFIKGEYDAERFNLGLGLQIKEIFTANFVLLDGKKLAFGANLQTRL